jgi:predicted DNA-binding ribbon-helix-helix protein
MPSPVLKRSVVVAGHKTSISLEDPFWQALREIATERGITSAALIRSIAEQRAPGNLSSAVRVFVLEHLRAASSTNRTCRSPASGSPTGFIVRHTA